MSEAVRQFFLIFVIIAIGGIVYRIVSNPKGTGAAFNGFANVLGTGFKYEYGGVH